MSTNREKIDFAETFKKRTKYFAIKIIKFCKKLPKTQESSIISGQLLRSSTSVASNYRVACRAISRKAFYSKMCIVVEEADEVVFWLEVIREAGISNSGTLQQLTDEGNEILSIVASSRKTAGRNLS